MTEQPWTTESLEAHTRATLAFTHEITCDLGDDCACCHLRDGHGIDAYGFSLARQVRIHRSSHENPYSRIDHGRDDR